MDAKSTTDRHDHGDESFNLADVTGLPRVKLSRRSVAIPGEQLQEEQEGRDQPFHSMRTCPQEPAQYVPSRPDPFSS